MALGHTHFWCDVCEKWIGYTCGSEWVRGLEQRGHMADHEWALRIDGNLDPR